MELRDVKEAYRIPTAWRDLALPGEPGKICRSPFRHEHKNGDAKPSFSVHDEGRRYHNHATGESGTVIDLVMKVLGCDFVTAVRFIEGRLGITRDLATATTKITCRSKIPQLRAGTQHEMRELADRRGFSVDALTLAQRRGFLHFASLWGHSAWCITDSRRELFEFRRVDCEHWPEYGRLSKRKCHCVGSGKNWPIGTTESEPFTNIVVVEGAPDFIAAFNFLLIEGKEEAVAPVGILGAGNHNLATAALEKFKGKRICVYPHADEAGRRAGREWARRFKDAGAGFVTGFDLSGLVKVDGTPGKDLADVARIDPDCFERNEKFWNVIL